MNYSITLCLVLLKESLTESKLGAQETLDPITSHPQCWVAGATHRSFAQILRI